MHGTSPPRTSLARRATVIWSTKPSNIMLIVSDGDGDFTRDYVSAKDEDIPAYTVFTRKDRVIRHFWSAEMSESDPGQDPRGAPDLDPLWNLLDTTPQGRGDWYPKLAYDDAE